MLGRLAAVAAMAALMAGCAGMESAGRNASRGPDAAPPPSVANTPAPTAAAPTPEPAPPAPTVGAATAPAPTEPPTQSVDTRAGGNDVVVPGMRERQVPAPGGDPRSTAERMQDIAAWDRCVMRVQSAFESDPMRPQLESPEEYCRQSLGMADRDAIPISRQERRR